MTGARGMLSSPLGRWVREPRRPRRLDVALASHIVAVQNQSRDQMGRSGVAMWETQVVELTNGTLTDEATMTGTLHVGQNVRIPSR